MWSCGMMLTCWLTLTGGTPFHSAVENLINIIEYYKNNASAYTAPEDASIYFENLNSTMEEYGVYDFIVIGAGAGGTVIANRLSEIGHWKVLLLEAGDYGNEFTDIPASYDIVRNTTYNWGYFTTPQENACLGTNDRTCPLPCGRGVGGSSIINGLIYSRASVNDFAKLAEQVNDNSWSFGNVLSYYKKSEDFRHRDPLAPINLFNHGRGGYYTIENLLPHSVFMETSLKGNEELGWPIIDHNNGLGLGVSPLQLNTRNGKRVDDGTGFVKPILNRNNLELLTNSYVSKILIDAETNAAQGVNFVRDRKSYAAYASKEVILCAGAIGSPKLLMLSGVGPRSHLESLQIPVIQNLEVGSSLRDHISYTGLIFNTNTTISNQTLAEIVEDYLQGYGVLTTAGGCQTIALYPSIFNNISGNVDIEIVLMSPYKSLYDLGFLILNVHTKSVGSLRLKSKNPATYPLIDPGYLSDAKNEDVKILLEGVKLALKMTETKSFKKMDAQLAHKKVEECGSHEYLSDAYWYCVLKRVEIGGFHPISTCQMGPNPNDGAVVDANGKVYGIDKLRVCDASIFPFPMSGHPHANVLMAGEKISDVIKTYYL